VPEIGVIERMRTAIDALVGRVPAPPPPAEHVPAADGDDASRREMALALIACLDAVDDEDEAVAAAHGALAAAGIAPLGVEGEAFDRGRHRAQGRVLTDDPGLDWRVASCVSRGWADGDRVLRPAEVWVYRLAGPDGG
jgi:hypothetical protein